MTEAGLPAGIASPRACGQGEEGTVLAAAAQEEGAGTRATCRRQPQPDFGSVRAAPRRDPPVPRCRCSSSAVRGRPGVGTALGTARTDFVPGGAATGAGICATPGQTPSPAVVFAEEPWSRELPRGAEQQGKEAATPVRRGIFPGKMEPLCPRPCPCPGWGSEGARGAGYLQTKRGLCRCELGFWQHLPRAGALHNGSLFCVIAAEGPIILRC